MKHKFFLKMKKAQCSLWLTTFAVMVSSGCVNTAKKQNQARKKVEERYQKELLSQLSGKSVSKYTTNWSDAKRDLLELNPKIRKAEFSIDDNIQSRVDVWKSFIPSLSVSLSDSQTFGEIGDLFTDTSFRVSSFFNFGNLIKMPSRLAALKLSKMGLEWKAEQTMRNEVIALYRLFREKELLEYERKAILIERQIIEETTLDYESIAYSDSLEANQQSLDSIGEKTDAWRESFEELYNVYYTDITLIYSDLPKIHYSPNELDFTDTSRWGVLELNLLSLSAIAEDADITAAYSRYLPTPYLSLSAPPLYSSSSTVDFDVENFRIGPSLSWSIDTKQSIATQIQRLKREKPFKRWEEDKRTATEIRELLKGKRALIDVQRELRNVRVLMNDYRTVLKAGLINDISTAIEKWKGFKSQEIALMAKEVDICTSFWLIDESKWSATTKEWKRIQVAREKKAKKGKKS